MAGFVRSPFQATVTEPLAETRTTDGVSVEPALLRTTVSALPSKTAAVELLVPRSMPT